MKWECLIDWSIPPIVHDVLESPTMLRKWIILNIRRPSYVFIESEGLIKAMYISFFELQWLFIRRKCEANDTKFVCFQCRRQVSKSRVSTTRGWKALCHRHALRKELAGDAKVREARAGCVMLCFCRLMPSITGGSSCLCLVPFLLKGRIESALLLLPRLDVVEVLGPTMHCTISRCWDCAGLSKGFRLFLLLLCVN